jgi:hypothetical protein
MTTNGTVSNYLQVMPKEYKQQGGCPTCGAPIYVDAACFKGKKLVALPFPYFTCQCRLNLQPQIVQVPYPVYPNPTMPLPSPWTEPQITWTVRPFVATPTTTNIPIPTTPTVFPTTAQPNTLDWKRFTQSGGVSQHPDLKNIICINAMSPVSMASGAMTSLKGDCELTLR